MAEVPQSFFDAADWFIHLANELAREQGVSRVSAVIMFAAARFNAHAMFVLDPEARKNLDAAMEYFVGEYRKMLRDNVGEIGAKERKAGGEAGEAEE